MRTSTRSILSVLFFLNHYHFGSRRTCLFGPNFLRVTSLASFGLLVFFSPLWHPGDGADDKVLVVMKNDSRSLNCSHSGDGNQVTDLTGNSITAKRSFYTDGLMCDVLMFWNCSPSQQKTAKFSGSLSTRSPFVDSSSR